MDSLKLCPIFDHIKSQQTISYKIHVPDKVKGNKASCAVCTMAMQVVKFSNGEYRVFKLDMREIKHL